MAQDYNPADNLTDEDRAKGGRNSHNGGNSNSSMNSNASGAAGNTPAARRGGKNSGKNRRSSR